LVVEAEGVEALFRSPHLLAADQLQNIESGQGLDVVGDIAEGRFTSLASWVELAVWKRPSR